MAIVLTLVMMVVAYFCGSIPSGFLIIRATTGKDIREHGSGNIGMANAYRVGGALPALMVLLGDALKGAIPVLIFRAFFSGGDNQTLTDLSIVLIGLAAIIGHDFPIFLRGHGGKGIATSLGVITALSPPVGLVAVIVWWIVITSTGYASLASLIMLFVAAIALAIYSAVDPLQRHTVFIIFLFALFAVAVWQHRGNIERLMQGNELKLRGERERRPVEQMEEGERRPAEHPAEHVEEVEDDA